MTEILTAHKSPSTIVVIDDHEVVRDALKTLLESSNRYSVIGQASNIAEGLDKIEHLKPDFILLDLKLASENGLELLAELKKKEVHPNVIVLSMYEDEQRVSQALAAGARGYLVKSASSDEFFTALELIARGDVYLPTQFEHIRAKFEDAIDEKAIEDFLDGFDPLKKLSEREKQVFALIASGEPNRIIAKKLFVSPRTVETHRARLLKKLSLKTTADLIRYAIKHDIISA